MQKTHSENSIQVSENGDSRYITTIGVSIIAALVILFLISTFFGTEGPDDSIPETSQVVPLDSSGADTLAFMDTLSFSDELPEFWLQARALSTGNAGWGPDVTAPFDTLWHIRSNAGREFFSSPAFVDGVLYLGCNDGILRAVDASSGSVNWTFATACGICGEPAVDSTTVYFGGQDGVVYALDRFSGAKLWSAGLGFHVFCNIGIQSDTLILTGNSMGKVCALDARSGEPVWDDEMGGIVLGPVIVDSMAVFSTEGGELAAFDEAGNTLWSKDYSSQSSPPSADTTGVYAGFSNGVVRKFSPDDGHVIWETDIVSSTSRCVLARPVIVGNLLLAGTNDGQLVCLSTLDGTLLWRQNFDNWLQLPPAVGRELIYIACDDQRLHIVKLADGAKVDSLEMNGYSGTAPLLVNGIIYFGNTSGDFTALSGSVYAEETQETTEEKPEEQAEILQEEIPADVLEEEDTVDEESEGEMVQALPSDTADESIEDTASTETD